MRNQTNLKDVFGKADEGFEKNISSTLARFRREETKPIKRMGLRIAIVAVIACTVTTGTVLAMTNTWGIVDFLSNRYSISKVLPGADEIIQTNIAQKGGETELANFSVQEAVFDGQNIYAIVRVQPSSPAYLLLGTDALPSDPMGNMGPLFSGKNGSISDYARDKNQSMIRAWLNITNINGSNGLSYNADFISDDAGGLTYMLSCRYASDSAAIDLELDCGVAPYPENSNMVDPDKIQASTLSFTISNLKNQDSKTSDTPVVYDDCGVRVDKVTLYKSPLAIYTAVEYTVVDAIKFRETGGNFRFEFVNAAGERLPAGAGSGGGGAINGSSTQYIQLGSLQAAETLPTEIILRGYCDGKQFDSHLINMK